MTRDEAKKIIMMMSAFYPNFKPADISMTVDAWAAVLAQYDFKTIQNGLMHYASTNTSGFAPTPAQVLEACRAPIELSMPNEMEAWSYVRRALNNSTYNAGSEFEKLPPEVQRAVGNPEQLKIWASTDTAEVDTVIMSNFQRTYRAEIQRDKARLFMPPEMRIGQKEVESLCEKLSM